MKVRKADLTRRLDEVEEAFVGLWRSMGSLWGISPTMAEIHGLLFITGEALSMDGLMERLGISRGNVSMSLSKLLEWGLLRRVHKRRDRREYYESIDDVWEMATLVAVQRKRREIDPILATLRQCKDQLSPETLGAASENDVVRQRRQRVAELLSFLTLVDSLAQRFFESHRGLRAAIALLEQKD